MIKYLVMGIKLFIEKKTCVGCGSGLLIPSWKFCKECSIKRNHLELIVSEVKPTLYNTLTFHCDKKKALDSDMLMYDENMTVIGYRNPLFKLKS